MQDIIEQHVKPPQFKIGDMVMGFAIHFPVSGKIKDLKYNVVQMEWEYFIENDNGYDGKLKERKILRLDPESWRAVEEKWNRALELMKDADKLMKDCKNMLMIK